MHALTMVGIAAALLGVTACSSSTAAAGDCSTSGAAATISASDGLTFSPQTATITHGQTVCWHNTGTTTHTVTSDDGTSFNDASLGGGATFTHTFSTAGSFAYHCSIHPGMTGTITVN